MDLSAVLKRNPQAAFRVYDGQATIVTSDPGQTMVLNEIGSTIWKQIDGVKTLSQILETVLNDYDISREQAEKDLLDFVASMHDHHLVS
jgi:hypothetical protein